MLGLLPTSTLKKYCAKEVLILVERMEQRPEDFNTYDSIWRNAIDPDKEHFKHYTAAERVLILRASKQMKQKYKRAKLLAAILKETIDPEPKAQPVRNPYYTGVTSPAQAQNSVLTSTYQQAQQAQQMQQAYEAHKLAHIQALQNTIGISGGGGSGGSYFRYDINTDTYISR